MMFICSRQVCLGLAMWNRFEDPQAPQRESTSPSAQTNRGKRTRAKCGVDMTNGAAPFTLSYVMTAQHDDTQHVDAKDGWTWSKWHGVNYYLTMIPAGVFSFSGAASGLTLLFVKSLRYHGVISRTMHCQCFQNFPNTTDRIKIGVEFNSGAWTFVGHGILFRPEIDHLRQKETEGGNRRKKFPSRPFSPPLFISYREASSRFERKSAT